MTPAFTIILPHKRNPGNNAALSVCLDCLAQNTAHEYDLIMSAAYDSPLYPRVQRMFGQSHTDCVCYWASDFFAAPNWDVAMLEAWDRDTIVTNVVVEPGAIAMHSQNLHKDFGRKPDSFRRAEFEAWAANDAPMLDGNGWVAPYMISRDMFFFMGGFNYDLPPDDRGFTAADADLFLRWQDAGKRIQRTKSYVYHLQGWSDEGEQRHEKRDK